MGKHEQLSKYLSLILRHKPEVIGLKLDKHGYISIEDLIKGVNKSGRYLDKSMLDAIIKSDSKRRYSYSKDLTKVRANQGHSIKVDLGLISKVPKGNLYHGTVEKFQESIIKKGLIKGSREYVHLSEDIGTAKEVGSRRGKPKIFQIDTKGMVEDGYMFYLSENKVWLTDNVPNKYLELI